MKKHFLILLCAVLGIILILFIVHVLYWNITTVSTGQALEYIQNHNASQTDKIMMRGEGPRGDFSYTDETLMDQYAFFVPAIEGSNPPELYVYRFIKSPGWPFMARYRFVSKIVGKESEDGTALVGSYSYTPRDIRTGEKSNLKCLAFFGSQVYWKTSYCEYTLRINGELLAHEAMLPPGGSPGELAFIHWVPFLGVADGTTRELVEAKFYNEERELLYTYSP